MRYFEHESRAVETVDMAKITPQAILSLSEAETGLDTNPIEVVETHRSGYRIVDGNHRYWRAWHAGERSVRALVIRNTNRKRKHEDVT